ncbi:histamine N-methyltransferase-like isoform X2 [Ptychodera flava]|uniref:histamine N-methyltransferase-like isoform X2 n=1 Tax=Ptychodera flava TaxID=63121 RepID=UPI00396A1587
MTQDLKALVLFPKEYFERYEVISRYGYDEYFLSQHDKNLKDTFESFVFCGKADSTLRVLAVGTSDDIEGTTVELYGRLNTGGMLFILLVTGAWEQMLLRMGNIVPESMSSKLGSATMRKMLQRRIPDVKMQTQYRKISFKFDEGFKENSEDGNMMLDFVLQVLDFRKTAPPEIVGDFMKFFKELCYEENGELYFPADDEIITVIKQ